MESLFQRRFTVAEEEERPKSAQPAATPPRETKPSGKPELHEGLIPAGNLPPASEALAQLFGDALPAETLVEQPAEQQISPAPTLDGPAGAPRAKRSGFLARLFKRAPQPESAPSATDPSESKTEFPEAPAIAVALAEANEAVTPVPETAVAPSAEASAEPVVLAAIPNISAPIVEEPVRAPDAVESSIKAEELPSAAAMLEDLFPSNETSILSAEEKPPGLNTDDEVIAEVLSEFPSATVDLKRDLSARAQSSEHAPEPTPELERDNCEAPVAVRSEQPGIVETAAEADDGDPLNERAPAGEIAEPSQVAESEPGLPAAEPDTVQTETPPSEPRRLYKDWALDEKLASHGEWVESHGRAGQRADLSGAELEASDLISVNLRMADMHDANLRASDLLLADLRDACLVRADLEEACLVGANLEGANLEGASLETAMGLVPRQFAGANLRDALLAPHLMEFDAVTAFERESKNAFRYFWIMSAVSAISWLVIAKTRDVQLLTDSSIIPFLRSRAAGAALPMAESYLIVPVALFTLYVLFHFHLQRLWDSVVELPAIFPDGHTLGDTGPGILAGLLRTHFRWMNPDPSSTRLVEKAASLTAAYAIVPATLLLYWVRYLTRQEIHGTVLLALLTTASAGMATYATLKAGRPQERWAFENRWAQRAIRRIKAIHPVSVAATMAALLLLLSAGVIFGVPHDRGRAPQFGTTNIRRWAPDAFWWAAYDPYPDLTEASISQRPANWNGADDQVGYVDGLRANNAKFRYAQAYGAFFANSHLWRADFQGAFLSEADLRGADLGQSSLRYAVMDHAQMNHANLDRSNLDGADMRRADLREANLSYCSLTDSILIDARLDGASLYAARLPGATLTRAILEKADLRESQLPAAHMDHADLRSAYLWSARLPGADLGGAQLEGAILIGADLHGANLGGAQLAGTVLNGTDLSETGLDGADLRGALGLTAAQVCSAKSRRGAALDSDMATQVEALCGR